MRQKYIEPKKTEKEYQELSRLGAKLGIPVPETFLSIMVKMPDGKILENYKHRSHSWNRNAYNLLLSNLAGTAMDSTKGMGIRTIDNTLRTHANRVASMGGMNLSQGYICPASNNAYGIVVGSGFNAETFEDYMLQTIIATGNGAGQLAYGQTEIPVVSDVGLTKTSTLVRYFNNNSAGIVTVNEVGLEGYCYQVDTVTSAMGAIPMFCRDHLVAPVVIPASGQLRVAYAFSLVYPA